MKVLATIAYSCFAVAGFCVIGGDMDSGERHRAAVAFAVGIFFAYCLVCEMIDAIRKGA